MVLEGPVSKWELYSDLVWMRSVVKVFKINRVPPPIFKGSRKESPFLGIFLEI